MTDKELYQQMLHFIECSGYRAEAIKKELKARLAQPDCVCGEPDSEGVHRKDKPCYVEPEPEPVAWMNKDVLRIDHIIKAPIQVCRRKQDEHYNIPLYTAPQKKEWVGLTDEEISQLIRTSYNTGSFVRVIEAKLKEKNT